MADPPRRRAPQAFLYSPTDRGMLWLDGLQIAWTWLAWLAILGAAVGLGVWAVRSGLGSDRGPTDPE
jgi:type IV secretory pathway TrbD component